MFKDVFLYDDIKMVSAVTMTKMYIIDYLFLILVRVYACSCGMFVGEKGQLKECITSAKERTNTARRYFYSLQQHTDC